MFSSTILLLEFVQHDCYRYTVQSLQPETAPPWVLDLTEHSCYGTPRVRVGPSQARVAVIGSGTTSAQFAVREVLVLPASPGQATH